MKQITPENAAEVFAPKIIKLTTQLQTSTGAGAVPAPLQG
jgi:hypothetical protein